MKKLFGYIILCWLAFACQPKNSADLTIAGSANMRFALQEIIKVFESEQGINTRLVIASSGMLTAQITEGAPFDILISADKQYPEYLCARGFCAGTPEVYAYGSLVIWTTRDMTLGSIRDLISDKIQRIAIPNPELAPYGKAARQALINSGIYEQIEDRLVLGENVNQTTQFIKTGAVDAGITAKSLLTEKEEQNKSRWLGIDQGLYTPIAQAVVCLKSQKSSHNLPQARKFQQFLFSDTAQQILLKMGYQLQVHE